VARAGQAEGDFEGPNSLAWMTHDLVAAGELELARDVALSITAPRIRQKALSWIERAARSREPGEGGRPA
jgi:hypothetical protein